MFVLFKYDWRMKIERKINDCFIRFIVFNYGVGKFYVYFFVVKYLKVILFKWSLN